MGESGICPVCWAFQDPDTGKCLVCGKSYTVLNIEPLPLKGFGRTQDLRFLFMIQNVMDI